MPIQEPGPVPKHAFLAALDCPTKGWRTLRESGAPESPGVEWRLHEGQQVQRLAREWIGCGVLLPGGRTRMALDATAKALADPANTLLFEATFQADGCVARADALRRTTQGWELLEIKSGSSRDDKKVNPEYIDDVGYTAAVMTAAGLAPGRIRLVLVSADYVAGSGGELIVAVDVTDLVRERAAVFRDNLADVAAALNGEAPTAGLCFACRKCDYYGTSCVDIGITDPLFDIPRISEQRFNEFRPFGRIANLPDDAKLTPIQSRIVSVIKSGVAAVDPGELAALDALDGRIYYLDFEAVQPAIPVFPGTSPYQKHPFQYSLHIEDSGVLRHREHLADHAVDWRRPLAERLLDDLGTTGRIVVYSNYEALVLGQLAAWFPDLGPRIEAVIARLFDLEKVVKNGYVHPGFRGRTSIKKVLPVMAPEFSYRDLEVSGGEDAAGVFALIWSGVYPAADHARHRGSLLKYCARDTLAMVKVHQGLRDLRR